jgi:hypothetical protein
MIIIAMAGLVVGAGLALWFSVFALAPVIVVVVLIASLASIVGGAGVSSSVVAMFVAVIGIHIGYLSGSVTLYILERREIRPREGLPFISTLPPPPTW